MRFLFIVFGLVVVGYVSVDVNLIVCGEYLIKVVDCVVCYIIKEGKFFVGGLVFKILMGILYLLNIIFDKEIGIGSWIDEEFLCVLYEGKGKNGENFYFVFFYILYILLIDEDVKVIKVYLFNLLVVY